MTALIVVPVFNEADTVGEVVAAARAYAPVLVVDDGSRDGSAEIARRAGAEVIRHPRRFGKGEAIRTGIAAARDRGVSVVVTLVAGVAHGWHVHEVPVAAIPRARQRSRFRPINDGVAIGGYLAGRVVVRWMLEAGALVGALVKPFLGERRRARHAVTLEQAAAY